MRFVSVLLACRTLFPPAHPQGSDIVLLVIIVLLVTANLVVASLIVRLKKSMVTATVIVVVFIIMVTLYIIIKVASVIKHWNISFIFAITAKSTTFITIGLIMCFAIIMVNAITTIMFLSAIN